MKKSFVVSIEEVAHSASYAGILCYPRPEKAELKKRLKELQKLGVEALEFRGEKRVSNVNVLGKGCVGIVLRAYVRKKKTALKVRRLDADRSRMLHEAEMLEKANSVGVGPKLLGFTSNLLSMQLVEGSLLPGGFENASEKHELERCCVRFWSNVGSWTALAWIMEN